MTPNDDDRWAADRFLFSLTLRLAGVDTDTRAYELTDDEIAALSIAFGLAAERRGIERAAEVADEHACQHCAHISAAIRAITTEGADK